MRYARFSRRHTAGDTLPCRSVHLLGKVVQHTRVLVPGKPVDQWVWSARPALGVLSDEGEAIVGYAGSADVGPARLEYREEPTSISTSARRRDDGASPGPTPMAGR